MSVNMHAILIGLLSVAHTREQAEHAAKTVLGDHAHELAEQIRSGSHPDDPDDYGGFVSMGADWAADLIDPKAQRAAEKGADRA